MGPTEGASGIGIGRVCVATRGTATIVASGSAGVAAWAFCDLCFLISEHMSELAQLPRAPRLVGRCMRTAPCCVST